MKEHGMLDDFGKSMLGVRVLKSCGRKDFIFKKSHQILFRRRFRIMYLQLPKLECFSARM
jgi:hypothetical protein